MIINGKIKPYEQFVKYIQKNFSGTAHAPQKAIRPPRPLLFGACGRRML